ECAPIEATHDAPTVEHEGGERDRRDDPEEVRLVVDAEAEGECTESEQPKPPGPPPRHELPEPDRLEEEHEDGRAEVDAGVEDEARVGREEDCSHGRDRG